MLPPRKQQTRQNIFFKNFSGASGVSLVSVLVAVGIVGIIAATIATQSSNFSKVTSSSGRRQDKHSLKQLFRDNVNCQETLGIVPTTPLPVACGSAYTLKRADGTSFPNPIGDWEYQANCINNSLTIFVKNQKADPITKQPDTFKDIFKGVSELCRSFFTGVACPAGQGVIGYAGSVPVCGVNNTFPSGSYCIVQAQNQMCPTGFSAVNPASGATAGSGCLNAEGWLLRGSGSSQVLNTLQAWGQNNSSTCPNQYWAFCCK